MRKGIPDFSFQIEILNYFSLFTFFLYGASRYISRAALVSSLFVFNLNRSRMIHRCYFGLESAYDISHNSHYILMHIRGAVKTRRRIVIKHL